MKPVVTLPPNYVYATASRISRRDFSRPFVPSCLLLTSVSFNFNPPVRILQGLTCVGLGFSFAWTVFVQAAPWVFAFQQIEHFQGGCVCVRATTPAQFEFTHRSNQPPASYFLSVKVRVLNNLSFGCAKPLGEVHAGRFLDSLGRAHAGLAETISARDVP